MANPQKQPAIKPMPFPGESPTVALAMVAGQQYGLHEEEQDQARPKRKASSRKHLTKAKRKATPAKKAPSKKPATTRKAALKQKAAGKKKAAR